MLIMDVESFINNIPPYISIDFLNRLDKKTLQIVGAGLLVSIFVFKNLYLFLLLFFQGKLLKELTSSTSNKLYHYYISMPYVIHLNRNPSILIRYITSDIRNTFTCIQSYIMLGLLEPQKGGVYFDNKNIKNELSLWQKQIGYIPQDIYLLDDTIKKNITFGLKEEEVDEKILLQTLKVSQLKDFVDTLPDAINTFVGDRGVKLSGGERQRIGIARALYNLPKIMVFDEATSSLDIENENKILDEIYENKDDKTLIIISHRNNTVKYCDLIYVLENGKIIDQGSFKEIMNKHGYLKEMNIK